MSERERESEEKSKKISPGWFLAIFSFYFFGGFSFYGTPASRRREMAENSCCCCLPISAYTCDDFYLKRLSTLLFRSFRLTFVREKLRAYFIIIKTAQIIM